MYGIYFLLNCMIVRIKKNHDFPLEYKTDGACAFDFYSSDELTLAPGEWGLVEAGTVVETPE